MADAKNFKDIVFIALNTSITRSGCPQTCPVGLLELIIIPQILDQHNATPPGCTQPTRQLHTCSQHPLSRYLCCLPFTANILEEAERTSMFAFRSGGAWEQGCCFKERNWSKMRNTNMEGRGCNCKRITARVSVREARHVETRR